MEFRFPGSPFMLIPLARSCCVRRLVAALGRPSGDRIAGASIIFDSVAAVFCDPVVYCGGDSCHGWHHRACRSLRRLNVFPDRLFDDSDHILFHYLGVKTLKTPYWFPTRSLLIH